MSVLITGVSGALAGLVTERLLEQEREVAGLDVRPLPMGRAFGGEFYRVRSYTQRRVAEVFRRHKPSILIHLGRIRGTAVRSMNQRYNQNVLGTRHLLALAAKHGVQRVVVLSTYHVYGAHQHNHLMIKEDAPLRASQIFPQLTDAVELDHASTTFLWRHRGVGTIVLRPANVIGPHLNNLMSRLLRSRSAPALMGYDPIMQFVHEQDMARAIVLAATAPQPTFGVFNVAGEGVVSYTHAVRLAGGRPVPVPHVLAYPIVGALARWRLIFPQHLIDYFRYPCVIDDSEFRRAFRFEPELTTVQALASVGQSQGVPR
ncbi:MAG: NAD-dependent epimerase/dehydratase family protein [Planctomycetota bacterium]